MHWEQQNEKKRLVSQEMQIINLNIFAMFGIFIEYCIFSKPLSTVQSILLFFWNHQVALQPSLLQIDNL